MHNLFRSIQWRLVASYIGLTLLTVALVGDIAHSRTARSNIWGLLKLGAHVIVCGPSTLVSQRWREYDVEVAGTWPVEVANMIKSKN